MKHIKEKALNFIIEKNLFEGANKIYVAVSGGADSMALLAYLNEYKSEFSIDIGVVHVNHGIRGETADRDENFVRAYCEKHDIEFIAFNASKDGTIVPENASEDWARQLRYNYFRRVLGPGVKIATAHTLSDQLETVIFRMARGSGIKGLTGIPAIREDGYVRPFLGLSRTEIEALVDHYGTSNITDETNLGDDYSRNKIRHHVVPVLKEINPSVEETMGKLCRRMDAIYEFISKQAAGRLKSFEIKEDYKYDIRAFYGVDEVIVDEMVMQLLGAWEIQSETMVELIKKYLSAGAEVGYIGADSIYGGEKLFGAVDLTDEYRVTITDKYITITDIVKDYVDTGYDMCEVDDGCMEAYYTSELGHGVRIMADEAEKIKHQYSDKFQLCHFADKDKLNLDKCIVRRRKVGDKFKPACKTGGKLSKFMRHVPMAEKDLVPVIECDGEVIWVWGVGFTDGYAPTNESTKVYKFTSI